MDLLGENPAFSVDDESWRIFSRHFAAAPQYIGNNAEIKNSIITEGCEIYGKVENSVIYTGVKIMEGATVRDRVIMGDCVIGKGATVDYSIIDGNVNIGEGAVIGEPKSPESKITVLGEDVKIGDGEKIAAGEMISDT